MVSDDAARDPMALAMAIPKLKNSGLLESTAA